MKKEKKPDLSKLKREELLEIMLAQREKLDAQGDDGTAPDTETIQAAYDEAAAQRRTRLSVRSTAFILVVAAAVAVLVAVFLLPVLRIYGKSMQDTLRAGDVAVSVKSTHIRQGDIIAFYYNNNVLVKRVIATGGDIVGIDKAGNVTVNRKKLDESAYLSSRAYGETNIELPYQVPDGKYFVMGDNRKISIDSRSRAIGPVASEQIVGKIVFRLWPLTRFGPVR